MSETFLDGFSVEKKDTRVREWFLMSSIYPMLIICTIYVTIALFVGPMFMKTRRPYEIKKLVMGYNIFQVIASFWIFQGLLRSGWTTSYSLICQPVDKNPNMDSEGYQMAVWVWRASLFRIVDFTDTFFFIARKKFEHVSLLQVIHHFLTPLYGFMLTTYAPGGNDSFGGVVNYFIHIVMYSYYFLSSLGPKYRKYLWWKQYLTQFQIIQFVISLFKTAINAFQITDCGFPWQVSLVSMFMYILMLLLFLEFYIKTYNQKKKKST
uniref:Elongation of very long chain fatty acids protein n=1 Tax=Platychelipus littoralis TaxID=2593136 RepID=A0A9E8LRG9_9MAXI|nr:fatty acid elongase elovl1c [Platychelipus littoralis]